MSITSDDIKNNGYIHPLADAAADEIEQLESRVAQLEEELAEARKDQERYRFVRDMKPIDFGNLPVNYTDFDRQIDAMIKGQQ